MRTNVDNQLLFYANNQWCEGSKEDFSSGSNFLVLYSTENDYKTAGVTSSSFIKIKKFCCCFLDKQYVLFCFFMGLYLSWTIFITFSDIKITQGCHLLWCKFCPNISRAIFFHYCWGSFNLGQGLYNLQSLVTLYFSGPL